MAEFKLPELGENIEEAEVIRVLVSVGDQIEAEQNVLEIESDKAAIPLPCPFAGKVTDIHVNEGDTIRVGQTLLSIEKTTAAKDEIPAEMPPEKAEREEEKEPAKDNKPAKQKVSAKASVSGDGKKSALIPAGPATRRLAREMGVCLEEIEGSGRGRRITLEDVARAAQGRGAPREVRTPPLPDFERWGSVRRERMNKLARTAAERLSLSWRLIPHVTQNDFVDASELEAGRKRFNEKGNRPKITMTALIVKAVAVALKEFPKFNSSYDSASGELIVKEYHHIGVAVDTEHGLLVPVLRNVDQKNVTTIAADLEQLAERARNRELAKEDMEGGTFTVSNLGGIAGTTFTPIINYPEVAILGVGRARSDNSSVGRICNPSYEGGRISNPFYMPLSLSYDHRVINGADGVRFIKRIAELLGNAFEFLLAI